MFFYIGNECKLLEQVDTGLFLDKGWTKVNSAWYKGYSTECNLRESLDKILNGYKPKGIWCVIALDDDGYKTYHPEICPFPSDGITNLHNVTGSCSASFNVDSSVNSIDTVVDTALSILVNSCQGYAKYNSDILNIWCTGGLDSVLLLAICEKANIPYNLYAHKSHSAYHVEHETEFTKYVKNTFPNYQFMSVFSNKTVLGTGYGGDTYFCRHPVQINLLANSLGLTAHDVVKSDHYVYPYLKRPMFNNMDHVSYQVSEEEVKTRILHGITQWLHVWHLDNTITFTPYNDISLTKIILTLPVQMLIEASLDGTIQKKAIEKCNPEFLSLVDKQKNSLLGGKNLVNNLDRVKLGCCKKIFIV
jgi:hypothetical protein